MLRFLQATQCTQGRAPAFAQGRASLGSHDLSDSARVNDLNRVLVGLRDIYPA